MAINWNRNQPIIHYLRTWLPRAFPQITRIGGYNNRTTAGGSFSAHSEGRAADIHLDANDPEELRIGDGLFGMFHSNAALLGVDHVIWNRQIWSAARGGPRTYTGSGGPHTDHIHVAFTREGSQRQPAVLIPLLDGVHLDLHGRLFGEPAPN